MGRRMTTGRVVSHVILTMMAVLLLGAPLLVYAQGGGQDATPVREVTADEVNRVSRKLYCPVCENIPLDVCGTAACARWRAQVRTLLEQGKTEDEVISYFVEQFGQRVVGTPQDPTLNFLSWAVPLASVVIGVVVAGYALVRWRRLSAPAHSAAADDAADLGIDDDYRKRLERELRNLE